uniref:NACHT domain-containing protein n=1 Tax=Monopterus albus TaxID=43700 RepID=A0A3Q3JS66_MONAL
YYIKLQHIFGHSDEQLLDIIYTELYITAGADVHINTQHEVSQIEMAGKQTDTEKPVKPSDMFKPPSGQYRPIKTVLTNGIAGIGKTFLVQKFVLDWAKRRANQDVHLIFPFTFRQLNLKKGQTFSLAQLIHESLQSSGNTNFDKSEFKLLFVLDGLDESRLHLDCSTNESQSVNFDVTESTSVDVLLSNLITRNLLPSARLWITTRPAAANQIHSDFVDIFSEVRGFTDPQKEEYIKKRLRDKKQASRIISHIKNSRSLHIMCHIPVFCWITATVLSRTRDGRELPKTLTEMYTEFLMFQIKLTKEKYDTEKCIQDIKSLAKLAFQQLKKGNLIFYERDLKESGIDVSGASVYSGVFTEIFKEERGWMDEDKLFSFVHLSVQEFLAALHVHLTFITSGVNLLKSLESKNGHLDLFVRFLHGLSLESNQRLLGGLLGQTENSPENIQRTINKLKEMNAYEISPDRSINIFHCLMEMNDHSVHRYIQDFLKSEDRLEKRLSDIQCSALAYMLQMSEEVLDKLDLHNYSTTLEGRRRLIPAVRNCRKARIVVCQILESHCEIVASALKSNPSHLRELEMTWTTDFQDSVVKLLSAGLKSPNCKLETLRLKNCMLSETSCASLTLALRSNSSHLRELELSGNSVTNSEVKLLSAMLLDPHCKLETLGLWGCYLSEIGCASLASVLKSNPSHLRELDLSRNDIRDSGVKLLSAGLESPHCRLETLRLWGCYLSEIGCASLASVLKSNPSHLRELDLSRNDIRDSGVKLLSAGLESPHCRLETLRSGTIVWFCAEINLMGLLW